jgi:hypothetical protein
MQLRYLLDENLSPRVTLTVRRHYPEIDVLRVGDTGAPAFGTLDPELLNWLDAHQRVLVTDNRSSMPNYLADHLAAGSQHWGIFYVRKSVPLLPLADALYVYWSTTQAEDWLNLTEWLPV